MNAETGKSATPRVGAVIATDESTTNRPNYVARCACGWNAVTSATDPLRAQSELRALLKAHRKACVRASSLS